MTKRHGGVGGQGQEGVQADVGVRPHTAEGWPAAHGRKGEDEDDGTEMNKPPSLKHC